MANVFDQFDSPKRSNVFNQFDAPKSEYLGPTPQEIQAAHESGIPILDASGQVIEPPRQQQATEPNRSIGEKITGGIEAAGSAVFGGASGLAGGLAGSVEGAVRELATGEEGLAEEIQKKRMQQFSDPFMPVTQTGKEYAGRLGEAMEPLGSLPPVFPQSSAMQAVTAPARVPIKASAVTPELPKVIQSRIDNRSRIIDQIKTSAPSDLVDDLERLADSNAGDLQAQLSQRIGEAAEAGVSHPTVKRLIDNAKTGNPEDVKSIISNDRRKAIAAESAPYRVDRGMLRKSRNAKKLIDMGMDEGDIQLFAGTSKAADKSKLSEIVKRARSSTKDALSKIEEHPQAVVGDSLLERLNAVDSIKSKAGMQIEKIADKTLRGKDVDLGEPLLNFTQRLDKMGVVFEDGQINYNRSALRGMPDMQKQINDVIEQLSPKSMPNADAYDAHILKQWFDNQINWGKNSQGQGGIPPKVERAIKDLRRDVNKEIGKVSPSYKKVNERYSDTVQAVNNLKERAGRNKDLGDQYANETLGMLAKRVTSNAMSRGQVKSAIDDLEKVAKKYGVQFDDDIFRQVAAVNALEKKMGSFSDTSLKGQIGGADVVAAGVDPVSAGVGVLKKMAGRKKSVKDEDFLKAVEDIIKGK